MQLYPPHISELYNRMGDIILLKIFMANFGFKLEKLAFFLIRNSACVPLSANVLIILLE